ncbi:MAG: hypothetical protein LBL33_08205 [Tannerella sp.]|jgi:hypothetical protein|nr:hypothetical protein [Tannerella sp.]
MKRFFSYSLSAVALVIHVAMVRTHVPVNDACMQANPFVGMNDTDSLPEDGYFFMMPDTPFIPAGLNNISNSRVPVSLIKTVNNPYYTLKSCVSSLIHQQIHIIELAFFSYYAKKEKDGYYIYALRKLLI